MDLDRRAGRRDRGPGDLVGARGQRLPARPGLPARQRLRAALGRAGRGPAPGWAPGVPRRWGAGSAALRASFAERLARQRGRQPGGAVAACGGRPGRADPGTGAVPVRVDPGRGPAPVHRPAGVPAGAGRRGVHRRVPPGRDRQPGRDHRPRDGRPGRGPAGPRGLRAVPGHARRPGLVAAGLHRRRPAGRDDPAQPEPVRGGGGLPRRAARHARPRLHRRSGRRDHPVPRRRAASRGSPPPPTPPTSRWRPPSGGPADRETGIRYVFMAPAPAAG